MSPAALGVGRVQANLPIIIVHFKLLLAKQSQVPGAHPEFKVQENLSQGNTWKESSPGRDIGLLERREGSVQGRVGLTTACPFPPEATSESPPLPLCSGLLL